MSTLERARLRALAVKVQGTPATDAIAGTPAAGDWIDAQFEISPDILFVADPSFTGSLDPRSMIAGGARFTLQGVRVPLRGSGTAGTEPEFFKILRSGGMKQTDTAAAIGAPTAATAGSTTTATLATPFAATADLYRGMPVVLSGNPATATPALITDYTAGRLATFSRTFATLTTSTLAQIPINNLLRLSDTETDWPKLTVYAYQGGQLYIGLDCIAVNHRLDLTRAEAGFLVFDILGVLAAGSPAETALPAGAAAVVRPTIPTWRGGESQIGRAIARAQSMSFSLGAVGILSPNPEAANGFDGGELMARAPRAEVTLMANSTTSPTRVAAMRAGTDTLLSAILGTTAGNRLGLLFSPGRITGIRTSQSEGAEADTVSMESAAPGAAVMISAF